MLEKTRRGSPETLARLERALTQQDSIGRCDNPAYQYFRVLIVDKLTTGTH